MLFWGAFTSEEISGFGCCS